MIFNLMLFTSSTSTITYLRLVSTGQLDGETILHIPPESHACSRASVPNLKAHSSALLFILLSLSIKWLLLSKMTCYSFKVGFASIKMHLGASEITAAGAVTWSVMTIRWLMLGNTSRVLVIGKLNYCFGVLLGQTFGNFLMKDPLNVPIWPVTDSTESQSHLRGNTYISLRGF